jgi:hypothetical protein
MSLETPLIRAVPQPGAIFVQWNVVPDAATYRIDISYVLPDNPGSTGTVGSIGSILNGGGTGSTGPGITDDTRINSAIPPVTITPVSGQSIIGYTISSLLTTGVAYSVSLTAVPAPSATNLLPSAPITVEVTPGLALTTGNIVVSQFSTSALLTWAHVPNATSYTVSADGALLNTISVVDTQGTYWYEVTDLYGPRVITVTALGAGYSPTMFMQKLVTPASGVSRYTNYTLADRRLQSVSTISCSFVDFVSRNRITPAENTIEYSLSMYNPYLYAFETVSKPFERNSAHVLYKALEPDTQYELVAQFSDRGPVVRRFTTTDNTIYPLPGNTDAKVTSVTYKPDTSIDVGFEIDSAFITNREAATNDRFRFWRVNIVWYRFEPRSIVSFPVYVSERWRYVRSISSSVNNTINIPAALIPVGSYGYTIALSTPDGDRGGESRMYYSYTAPTVTDITRNNNNTTLSPVGWTDVTWSYSTDNGDTYTPPIIDYYNLFGSGLTNVILMATPNVDVGVPHTYVINPVGISLYKYMSKSQRVTYAAEYAASLDPDRITDVDAIDSDVLNAIGVNQTAIETLLDPIISQIPPSTLASVNMTTAANIIQSTVAEELTIGQLEAVASVVGDTSNTALADAIGAAAATILSINTEVTPDDHAAAKNIMQTVANIYTKNPGPPPTVKPLTYTVNTSTVEGQTDKFAKPGPITVSAYSTPSDPNAGVKVNASDKNIVYVNAPPGGGSMQLDYGTAMIEMKKTQEGSIQVGSTVITSALQFVQAGSSTVSPMVGKSIIVAILNSVIVDILSRTSSVIKVRVTLNQIPSMIGAKLRYDPSNGVAVDTPPLTTDDPVTLFIPTSARLPISFSIIGTNDVSTPVAVLSESASACCVQPHPQMDYETYMRLLRKRVSVQRR